MEILSKEDRKYFAAFIVIGVIVAAIGIFLIYRAYHDNGSCTQSCEAVVADIESHRKGKEINENKEVFVPVFEYEYKGEKYVRAGSSVRYDKFEKGDKVTILIDPDRPQNIYIQPDFLDNLLYYFIIFTGGFSVLVGSVLLFGFSKK